jgi:hypothetical protein
MNKNVLMLFFLKNICACIFGLNDKFISHIKFLLKSKGSLNRHTQILTKQTLAFFFLK